MCGVSGYTGLGHLSADIRFDLVEALGCEIDTRGGHASGAVVITDDGPPRLLRKLGLWSQSRGRFIRAASLGHSVMMHARWATTGAKDEIENAHPFAIKRKDADSGKEVTILYGCHNGVLYGTSESAKAAGREHSVDSKEFFELLADKAYETIKALHGYGVVTYVRPEDRKVRVLRLSNQSDFVICRLKGGGTVWASTDSILKDALKYVGLEEETRLSVASVGRVYVLSGKEAKETKVEDLSVGQRSYSSRASSAYGTDSEDWSLYSPYYSGNVRASSPCHKCGFWNHHQDGCHYSGRVILSETVEYHRDRETRLAVWNKEAEAAKERGKSASAMILSGKDEPVKGLPLGECRSYPTDIRQRYSMKGKTFTKCTDGTYRQVNANGNLIPGAYPMFVHGMAGDGMVAVYSNDQACMVSGMAIRLLAEKAPKEEEEEKPPSTQRLPVGPAQATAGETGPVEDNGFYATPPGISDEEEEEWRKLCQAYPRLAREIAEEEQEERQGIMADLSYPDPVVTESEPTSADEAEVLEAAFTRQMLT